MGGIHVGRRPFLATMVLTIGMLFAFVGPAAATPLLNLDLHHNPTHFAPGSPGQVLVTTGKNGEAAANEIQQIAVLANGGRFHLRLGADQTADLPTDAGGAQVQAALQALSSIGAGNVAVSAQGARRYTLTFTGALAHTDVPQLLAESAPSPDQLRLGSEYWVDVANVGDAPTSAPLTLTIKLPNGLSRNSIRLNEEGGGFPGQWSCPGSVGDATLTCTAADLIPAHRTSHSLILAVNVANLASGTLRTATATLTGGGAPAAPPAAACAAPPFNAPAAVACAAEPTQIDAAPAGFGILAPTFTPDFFQPDALTPVRAASSHPPFLTVPFDFNTVDSPDLSEFNPFNKEESGHIRDLTVDLPPGFLGNPTAVGECSDALFNVGQCPLSSQVGRITVTLFFNGSANANSGFTNWERPVYNLSHPRGAISDLAFTVVGNPIHIKASLDPANRYAIRTTVSDINETSAPKAQRLTIWGVPADPSHDFERCPPPNGGFLIDTSKACPANVEPRPFITLPAQCESDSTWRLHHYDSWQEPGVFGPEIPYTPPGLMSGCDRPRFEPDVEIEPTGHQANSPTGLDIHIQIAQNENPNALATPPVRTTTVTLPAGMSFSPSFADGLQGCAPSQIGLGTDDPVTCPDASRIGEVSLHTPLLPKAAEGSMYLAAQGDNPFGSTFALYLALHDVEERGALIKIPGRVDVDPATGQITTVFPDTPQFPFDDLTLKFRSGPRAPLVNPPSCGTHTIAVQLTSYAQPDVPVDASNTYQVSEGPNGTPCPPDSAHRPFAPDFHGGSLNPVAGSYSTFLFRLNRTDDEQELSQVNTFLPPGLLAKVAGIPLCPDAVLASISTELGTGVGERDHPACPPASAIGTVSAGLGAGPGPNYFPGRVYLAGPYKGAPLSLAIAVPGLAGPYDLGNVVVRVALRVDPETSRVTAVSDPFPTILHGVLLRVRDVRLRLDRPETTLNPTNCSATSLNADITGVGGDLFSTADDSLFQASDRFQVGDCGRLGFKPKIFFKLKGGTHRGDHPAFFSRVLARPGDANFGKAIVALPKSEFLENAHIGTVCTRVQFRADQCPAASIYGHAKAVTPLLDDPVEGDLILRSSDHPLPDLVARLRGQISANLVGRIDSVNGGIRSSFESVPDVPVREFTLTMLGGDKGLLVNSRNLCKAPARADVKFTSQSNKFLRLRPLMQTSCRKPKAKKRHKRHHRVGH